MAAQPERAARRPFSRLGLKLAAAAAGTAFLVGGALRFAGVEGAFWAFALGCTLVGAGVYAVADGLLSRRLGLARRTLQDVRHHRFDSLEKLPVPRGDELDALVWQVYRTGLALEKEIGALKKLENYRREYIGNVSHELKTPIFAIQGFAETLLDGGLDDARVRRQFVEKILRHAQRLRLLTRDLAELSRIETGELKMEMAPFSLARVAAEVAEALELVAADRRVRLALRVPDGLPPAWGDRERIRQVLTNLVENGVKYNNAGGLVEVVARRLPEGGLKVTVADDGIGVAPQHVPRLTERFFRADASRSREQGGTGLGLAIVKHILAAHGSRLLVESKLGQGSSFGFTLPLAPMERALPP